MQPFQRGLPVIEQAHGKSPIAAGRFPEPHVLRGEVGLRGYCHAMPVVIDRFGGKELPSAYPYTLKKAEGMRKLMSWASTIPKAMVDGWMEAAPHARLHSVQGMTESTAAAYTTGSVRSWAEMPNGDGRWVGTLTAFGAEVTALAAPDKQVHSVCPFCGVGCQTSITASHTSIA